jgi:hypothetical protein
VRCFRNDQSNRLGFAGLVTSSNHEPQLVVLCLEGNDRSITIHDDLHQLVMAHGRVHVDSNVHWHTNASMVDDSSLDPGPLLWILIHSHDGDRGRRRCRNIRRRNGHGMFPCSGCDRDAGDVQGKVNDPRIPQR